MRNQFDFSRTDILGCTVVKFMQIYYTIDVDFPEKPRDCFLSSVSWENLKDQRVRDRP